MNAQRWFVNLRVCAALLLFAVTPSLAFAGSTKMKPAEYQKFVSRLQTSIPDWQQRLMQLDLSSIAADRRDEARSAEQMAYALLKQVKEKLQYEQEKPSLARQIYMNRDLSAASSALGNIAVLLPNERREKMEALAHEIGEADSLLFLHVTSEADDYEYQLEDCTQAKP